MNSKLTGEGAAADDDDDVKKNHCNVNNTKAKETHTVNSCKCSLPM